MFLSFSKDIFTVFKRCSEGTSHKITLFSTNSQTYYYQSSEIINKKLRGNTITAQQKQHYSILGISLPRIGHRVTMLL
jgi:hypothetical protein